MKTKSRRLQRTVCLLTLAVWLSNAAEAAEEQVMTVPDVLRLAEQASPDLKAAMKRERVSEQTITFLKSYYYPTVDAQAIQSYGFPGSTSGAMGIQGLMGSPYRSGPAAGLTSSLTLFDWGRGYGVQSAHSELKAVQAQTQVTRFGVDQAALQIYLDASRFRGQHEAYLDIAKDVADLDAEVEKFVRTGQRSVVDRLLVQDQTTDAQMTAAAYQARYQVALQRLALATEQPVSRLACPTPEDLTEQSLGLVQTGTLSPLITQGLVEAQAAHANISFYSAQNLPKIKATASVGDMDESRLVDKKDYAGGFGLDWPLFEGNRISSQIHQAEALAAERDQDLNAVRLRLDELNAQYDEISTASRVQLDYLEKELDIAQQAFTLARKRYFAFQGTLVDVRESIRNLERVQAETIDVKTELLLAVGSKALLNGATVQP